MLKAVKHKTCFAVAYYDDEHEAAKASQIVSARGDTYSGGFLDGMKCGRESARDFENTNGKMMYAVTLQGSAPRFPGARH